MADVKISDLTAKSAALATTDTLEINESGTSKSVTGANIIDAVASATQTLTNKTFDANATGNSLSNVDVADLASGTDGELITWNASGAPAVVSVGTDGQLLTSAGAGSPPAFEDAAGGGKVLQVVEASGTTQVSTTSGSYVDTGITAAVTPSASDSKVLVLISVNVTSTGSRAVGEFKIVRTIGGSATNLYVYSQVNHLEHENAQHFLSQLDSPSTTSATTYKLQFFRTDQSGTLTVNRNDGSDIARSTITLLEVGA